MGQKSHADTSWLIALLNPEDAHHTRALKELDELNSAPSVSAFAFAELLVNFELNEAVDIDSTLTTLKSSLSSIISLDSDIAIKSAQIRSNNKITLGDAIIIATALSEKSKLLTFDKNMRSVYERIK
jgi:predicted nucleic acid-binding protein